MPRRADSPPPNWDRVQAWALAHITELAHEYGGVTLNRAGRAPCPLHGGEHPNLSVEDGKGFHCFTCGAKGDGVALVAALTNRERLDVLRELAPRANVWLDTPPRMAATGFMKYNPPTARAERPAPPDPLAPMRADGHVPSLAPAVHRAVWEVLTLTPRGADYLRGRGLDPDAAHAYGFRSLDGPHAWDAVREVLEASFLPEELHAAGWYTAGDPTHGRPPRLWHPYTSEERPRPFPASLALPYWWRRDLVRLRFRNLAPDADKNDRYRDVKGAALAFPFNADALDDAHGAELHVCEGELDAFTLHLYGARVVGLPGATGGKLSDAPWLATLADVGRVVTWYDNDDGGRKGRQAFAQALAERFGRAWLAERGRAVTLHDDDVNGCHQRGALADFFTRAEWRT